MTDGSGDWSRATEGYRARAATRHDDDGRAIKFVVGVHAVTAFLTGWVAIGLLLTANDVLRIWLALEFLGVATFPTISATAGLWMREVPLWIRFAASASAVLGAVVTGVGLPFLLNVIALGVLAVLARRRRGARAP